MIILGLLGVGVVFILGILLWWRGVTGAPSAVSEPVRVVITRGSSSERIGEELAEAGVIRSALAFKIYVQMKSLASSIPTGQFEIPANLSLGGVVEVLMEGPSEFWVTIPEGLRREEVAERVAQSLGLGEEEAGIFVGEFLAASAGMEGYLFPDTYLFPAEVEAGVVVSTMRSTFDKKHGARTGTSGLSLYEVVTLASIVERETRSDEERPVVAGIYLKRLRSDWALDACASVQYVIGEPGNWWVQITPQDREVNSPYNTYQNVGLPPGPISNPGLASLNAVVASEDSPYWFYIHDSEGQIHYARTLEEHNANIERYLR